MFRWGGGDGWEPADPRVSLVVMGLASLFYYNLTPSGILQMD